MFNGKAIDKRIPVPMYYQLKNIILDSLADNTLQVDDMIPTEKELSDMFQISRTTVRQAILELTQEGYLYRVKSKGTFVAKPKDMQSFIVRLESFDEHIKSIGKTPRTEVLSCEIISMPATVADFLKCQPRSEAIRLVRLRFADDVPVVSTTTYLPYDKCRRLLDEELDLKSLYASMATSEETRICKLNQCIEAVAADERDAELLHIRRGSPIQLLKIMGINKKDVPLEYTYARFRGDFSKFECAVLVDKHI